jgi:hypothetical protein
MTDFSYNAVFYSTTEAYGVTGAALTVKGGVGVGGNVYMGGSAMVARDCYVNVGTAAPVKLSMTDFSYNAVFYSTSEAYGLTGAALTVKGGLGLGGNMYTGRSAMVGRDCYVNVGTGAPIKLSMTDFSYNAVFYSTTEAYGVTSGSVVVKGGSGVGGNIWVGGSAMVGRDCYVNVGTGAPVKLSMTDFSYNAVFYSTTEALGVTSGSVVVKGGAGVGGNIWLGGSAMVGRDCYVNVGTGAPVKLSMTDFSYNAVFYSTTEAYGVTGAALTVKGGVGVGGNMYMGGTLTSSRVVTGNANIQNNLIVAGTTNATGTGTGSLQVLGGGGMSVGGNIFVGGATTAAYFIGGNTSPSYRMNMGVTTCYSLTSLTTLTVSGGIAGSSLGGSLYLGGSSGLYSGGSIYCNNAITSAGSLNAGTTLNVSQNAYVNGDVFVNTGTGAPVKLSMTDFSANVVLHSPTDATSPSSGSLQVQGGVGILGTTWTGGDVFVGNNCYINSSSGVPIQLSMTDFSANVTFRSTSDANSTASGAIRVMGGMGVGGSAYINRNMVIYGTATAINTKSGALQVQGGMGVTGNVFLGGGCTAAFFKGGSTVSTNTVSLGPTSCYSLSSLTSVTVSGNVAGSSTGGSLYLGGTSGMYAGGSIYCNSTVTAAAFPTTSDYRIKRDVVNLGKHYTVDRLRPVQYRNTLTHQVDIGFIAHEVQQEYPFLVHGEKDGVEYQSLNYIGMIGLLVKEIQDLKSRISWLENEQARV